MKRWILGVALFLLIAAPARAGIVANFSSFQSGTNGIVLGPDGNFWVAEENSGTVARMTPSGDVLKHYDVGANPTSLATGPNNTVWVTVTGADRLVWFDATAA